MIRVNVDGVSATVTEKEILTAGRVGLECAFTFTGEWEGLFKTAVFQGVESVDVALPDNTCVVPWEAMQVEGVQLKIGVFGANGAGTIVIPTIWANAGKIQPSAIGGGAEPSDPSQNANAYAVETAEEAKDIALSVQQRADNGEFDGAPGAPGADGSTIWTTTVAPAEPMGGGYEFMVSDLTGVSGGTPAVGDLIFYDSAYYPITSVTGHSVLDQMAIADTRTSIRGATGPAATDEQVQTAVDAWLEEHPEEIGEQVQDAVDEYLSNHPTVTGTFTNEAKNALLTLLEKVAYTVSDGQTYLDALRTELFRINVNSISAVFTQGSAVIYTADSLDTLKQYLVVTATYSDGTSATVTNYTLSGTLTAGTSTITVSYGGKTDSFSVVVTNWDNYYYSLENNQLVKIFGSCTGYANDDPNYGNIDINTSELQQGRRRAFAVTRTGVKPIRDINQEYANTEYYPIPIPSDAVRAVVTITPSSQFIGNSFFSYTGENYVRELDPGWEQGSFTYTFTANTYKYITVVSKYNSTGKSYPTEPSSVTVQFLTE